MSQTCPSCGTVNRDSARFCSGCAAPLAGGGRCPQCGAANGPGARFCSQCAAPLTPSAPLAGTGMLSTNTLLGGRYLIVQRIGQGGMGAVYKATDTRLGQKVVAIKELSEAALTSPLEKQQARQAFEQEAQMLARLNHANLPAVTDHFSENTRLYLVMDFIDGRTLDDVLAQERGPLPESRVLAWAQQLCSVLEYLHGQNPPIVFRDLKPSNIMVEQGDKIRLIDFGIARLFKPGKSTDTSSFGTAGYAPPEQYGTGQTDARSDLYALGATLHQLLTGCDPGQTPFLFQPVRSLNPGVSATVEQAVMRAVEQDPARRWQSAAQMRQGLTAQAQAAPAPSAPMPPASVPAMAQPSAAAMAAAAAAYVATPAAPGWSAPMPAAAPRPVLMPAPRPGFWAWLMIAVGLSAATSFLLNQLRSGGLASDVSFELILWYAIWGMAAPLLYKLTRRGGSATLLACLAVLPVPFQGHASDVLTRVVVTNLAYGLAVDLLFRIGHEHEPRYWQMAFGPVAGHLAWIAADSALGLGSFSLDGAVVSYLLGAFMGGTVAWVIGITLGDKLRRPMLYGDRANVLQALCITGAALAAGELCLTSLPRYGLVSSEVLLIGTGAALIVPFVAKVTRFPGAAIVAGLLLIGLPAAIDGPWTALMWETAGIACAVELFYLVGGYRSAGYWRTALAPAAGLAGVYLLYSGLRYHIWTGWAPDMTSLCIAAFCAATVAYLLARWSGR